MALVHEVLDKLADSEKVLLKMYDDKLDERTRNALAGALRGVRSAAAYIRATTPPEIL